MEAVQQNRYELQVKSSTGQLASIRDFIRDSALAHGVVAQVIDSLILATDEAATNIVKHAYHMKSDGEIVIILTFTSDECIITLIDYGDSFDPSMIPSPDMKEYLSQRRVGGLGLYLIRTLMDSVEYQASLGDHNRLIMIKKLN